MDKRTAGPRLAVTALLTGALLGWAPQTLANAYPDEPTAPQPPVCEDVAPATVIINGGTVTNTTTLDLSADGGTGIGDSSGGDDNLATTGGADDRDRNKGRKNDRKRDRKDRRERNGDSETSAAGNGGVSDAGADGGAVAAENVNSGGNVGSAIAVGDTVGGSGYGCYPASGTYSGTATGAVGGVYIDGGTVTNETVIEVSADGGTAIADASGGDNNIAANGGRAGNGGSITSSAGNGGVSTASADGGVISLGNINSGGNAGNAIAVGDTVAGPGYVPSAPPPYKPVPITPAPAPVDTPPGKVVIVTKLPSTGEGSMAGPSAAATALLALAVGMASLATRFRMR